LGLERAGMRCLWQVEIDEYCRRVLAKHWPDVERFEDVKEVHGVVAHAECDGQHRSKEQRGIGTIIGEGRNEKPKGRNGTSRNVQPCPSCLPPVDLICGGFPCQPHSVAGKRKGAEDDRNLWPEYLRIVAELRPKYVVAENVPGIVTTYLDTVLSDLEGEGYITTTLNLPACAFDAPHRRERIFVVALAEHKGPSRTRGRDEPEGAERCAVNADAEDVAYAESRRAPAAQQRGCLCSPEQGGQDVADAALQFSNGGNDNQRGRPEPLSQLGNGAEEERSVSGRGTALSRLDSLADGLPPRLAGSGWLPEPGIRRVATGVPDRVAKLRALGNAVVPDVTQWIGERIMEVEYA